MANFVYQISDKAFELLKKMEYVKVYDEHEGEGEVDPPKDIIKSLKPSLVTKFQTKLKGLGLEAGDSPEPDNYFLVIARNEDKAKECISALDQDALLVESAEVGRLEVNGVKNKYSLFLVVKF